MNSEESRADALQAEYALAAYEWQHFRMARGAGASSGSGDGGGRTDGDA